MSASNFLVKEHVLPGQHIRNYPHATAGDQEDVLSIAIKQYVPRSNLNPKPGDVSIIGAHANGFPKELYEPLWDELLQRSKANDFSIRGIWIADVAFQGASSVVNEGKLGNDPSWYDHPRDLLHMVNHFRAELPRPIVGIGHSLGANHMVNLSLMHPRLFEALCLVDPVIQRHTSALGNLASAQASSVRRDRWPSRNAAKESFQRSKMFQAWDPRVLDRWVEYGLRDLPTALYPNTSNAPYSTEKEITLTTTKHQEVLTYLRQSYSTSPRTHWDIPANQYPKSPFYQAAAVETFNHLPHVHPPVLYVFGGESLINLPEARKEKTELTGIGSCGSGGAKAGNVQEAVIKSAGHLVPMEAVTETAEHCTQWLGRQVGPAWRELEAREAEEWRKVSAREKAMIPAESMKWLRSDDLRREVAGAKSKL